MLGKRTLCHDAAYSIAEVALHNRRALSYRGNSVLPSALWARLLGVLPHRLGRRTRPHAYPVAPWRQLGTWFLSASSTIFLEAHFLLTWRLGLFCIEDERLRLSHT